MNNKSADTSFRYGKNQEFQSFNEFWPFYVSAHSQPLNRKLHFVGTLFGFVSLFVAAITENPWWIVPGPVLGYALAWCGHFFIEKNKPATFRHPHWSLWADFRMFYLILNGKMNAEIEKLRIHQ